jgi:hypothetical protein
VLVAEMVSLPAVDDIPVFVDRVDQHQTGHVSGMSRGVAAYR